MKKLHNKSKSYPISDPDIARLAAQNMIVAESMGIYGTKPRETADFSALRQTLRQLWDAGIAQKSKYILGNIQFESASKSQIIDCLNNALQGMVHSPLPESELPTLEKRLGFELLSRLLGIHASSLQRYKAGKRDIPDEIANQLHFLALLIGDLSGSYNDFGIRLWFLRKRKVLGNKAPVQILSGRWSPESPGAEKVRRLAHDLTAPFAS